MKSKILLFIIVLSVVVALVSSAWFDGSKRSLDFSKLEMAVESVGNYSDNLRTDFEFITATVQLIEFTSQDTNLLYTIRKPTADEVSSGTGYWYIAVNSFNDDNEFLDRLEITTSYSLEEFDEFRVFYNHFVASNARYIALMKQTALVDSILIPDNSLIGLPIPSILQLIYDGVEVFVNGINIIITFIPIALSLFIDSLLVIKDLAILPFRLLF